MQQAELVFDSLAPVEVPVSIGGKKYLLREASGDAACKWRNHLLRSTKLGPDGKPSSIDGMADSEPLLVSLCLFETYDVNGQTKDRPVLLSTVRSWPARIQKALFERVKAISDLDEAETEDILQKRVEETQKKLDDLREGKQEEARKNGHGPTPDGSALPMS